MSANKAREEQYFYKRPDGSWTSFDEELEEGHGFDGGYSYEEFLVIFSSESNNDDLSNMERNWQKSELTKVDNAIYNYRQDQLLPEVYSELREPQYTEDDYYSLLGDRKLLVEYIKQEDFPECGRPILSGLANSSKI